jgi:activator of 2-hydroxyglutaryl-CoA dehydratase
MRATRAPRITAGIDVGSSAVKTVLLRHGPGSAEILAKTADRLRHRDVRDVAQVSLSSSARATSTG